jgi:hypothetical protein
VSSLLPGRPYLLGSLLSLLLSGPALAELQPEPLPTEPPLPGSPPVSATPTQPDPHTPPPNAATPPPPDTGTPPPPDTGTPPPPAAVPTTPNAAAAAAAAADEAVLAELGAEVREETVLGAAAQPLLSLYGFADFTFYKYFLHRDSGFRNLLYTESAFAVGNLNLYLASSLGQDWSSMAEVRFTYMPNGSRSQVDGDVERTDTTARDYTGLGFERRTGSVVIERAWLEYMPASWIAIRGGQWLTPYGIWNVDHGSPTIIPVNRPFTILYSLLPERQTGIQIEGTYDAMDDLRFGAIVGLSNGRGPVDEYADLDSNKALTARISATLRGRGTLQLGSTLYYGRYTDLSQRTVVNGAGARVEDELLEQFDELAIAADVLYKLGGFHFQAEFISSQQKFTEHGRPMRNAVEFWPDLVRFGAYTVTGYRFDWFGLMPFVMAEYVQITNNYEPARPPSDDGFVHFSSGLNARPTPNVTLKLQGQVGVSATELPSGSALEHPLYGLQSQAAWAF